MEQLWNSGSLLAAACGPAVHFWVAADGRTTLPEPVVRATAHGSSVRSLAWTGNNRVLCCAGDAPGVDVHSSEGIICNLGAGRSGGITSLRCTASKYLVVGNQDGTLQLMQLATQSLVGASKAHRSKVVTLATNRSGGLVASADSTGRVLLLSEDPFEVKAELSSPAARVGGGAVYSLAFNPLKSSPLLLAGSQHCGALLWDVTRPQSPAVAIQLPSAAAAGGDAVSAACFHPTDPNLLYVTLRHGRKLVKVDLRLPTGGGEVGSALMPSLSHEPTCLAAHGEGALLAVGTSSGGVALYGTDLVLEKMLQCGGVGGRQAFPPPVTDLAWQSRRASLSSSKKGSTGGGSVVGGSISSGSPRAAPSESPNAAAAATGSPTRMMGGAPTTAASLPASSAAAAALAVPQTGSSILASTSLAAAVAAVRPPTANAATATAAASVRPSSNEAPSTSGLTAAAAAATRPSAAAPLAAAGSPAGATSSTAAAATGAPAAAQQLSQMQMTQLQSDIQRSVHAAVAAAVGSGSAAAVATTSSGGPALDRAVAVAVRSALDGFAEEVRSRLLDVHMEVIRQAHDTGAQLMSAIGGVAARQDRLEAEQAALREQIAMLLRRADIVRRL